MDKSQFLDSAVRLVRLIELDSPKSLIDSELAVLLQRAAKCGFEPKTQDAASLGEADLEEWPPEIIQP